MTVLPMPCCGAEPPVDLVGFGWDPHTGLCLSCGTPRQTHRCETRSCHSMAEGEARFCVPCREAFDLAVAELGPLVESLEQRVAMLEVHFPVERPRLRDMLKKALRLTSMIDEGEDDA